MAGKYFIIKLLLFIKQRVSAGFLNLVVVLSMAVMIVPAFAADDPLQIVENLKIGRAHV